MAARCDTQALQQVANRWPHRNQIKVTHRFTLELQHCMFLARGLVSCQPELMAALEPYAFSFFSVLSSHL